MLSLLLLLPFAAAFVDEDQRRAVANRIREALRLSNIGVCKAAQWMGMGAPELEKALSGDRALNLWRTLLLPPEFHQHYHLIELRDRGLPDYAKTALKILPALEQERQVS